MLTNNEPHCSLSISVFAYPGHGLVVWTRTTRRPILQAFYYRGYGWSDRLEHGLSLLIMQIISLRLRSEPAKNMSLSRVPCSSALGAVVVNHWSLATEDCRHHIFVITRHNDDDDNIMLCSPTGSQRVIIIIWCIYR